MISARAPLVLVLGLGLGLAACTSAGPSVETGDTPEREGQRETVEPTQRCKVEAPPDMPGQRSSPSTTACGTGSSSTTSSTRPRAHASMPTWPSNAYVDESLGV
jgi:hypothetical protein